MVQIRCLYCKRLVDLPAKICPFCNKSLSGVTSNEFDYNKSGGSDPLMPLPTSFEKKAGVPSWVLVMGALVLISLVFFLAPILLDATPRDKKTTNKQQPAAAPVGAAVLAPSPVVLPTIRDNIDGAAALHNSELDQELMEEGRFE